MMNQSGVLLGAIISLSFGFICCVLARVNGGTLVNIN